MESYQLKRLNNLLTRRYTQPINQKLINNSYYLVKDFKDKSFRVVKYENSQFVEVDIFISSNPTIYPTENIQDIKPITRNKEINE